MKLIITRYINEEQTSKKKVYVRKNRIDAFIDMVKMNMYANEKLVIESINNGNVSKRWCLR